jgi:uncharacterized protein YceH (UPF0502 family)
VSEVPEHRRIDDTTRDLGLRKLAELRARRDTGQRQSGPAADEQTAADERSVESMVAEMATAAERERLERRVAALEDEVGRLRAAVAAAVSMLASALGPEPQGRLTPRPEAGPAGGAASPGRGSPAHH